MIKSAVEAGGGVICPVESAQAVVWIDPLEPLGLRALLDTHGDHIDWVQLVFAGIDPFVSVLDDKRLWTSGKDVYSEPVAEHILMLALAGLRGLATFSRASEWSEPQGKYLFDSKVLILGGGGITRALIPLLLPFRVDVTVVKRTVAPVAGANRVISLEEVHSALPESDLVVVALALTEETRHVIDRKALELMKNDAWLVNLARGAHVDTDALVDALSSGELGGAALDVTDPEPLPAGHPLWSEPRCLITPHVGNTPEMAVPLLSARITQNVRRFGAGEELDGVVDSASGY